MQTFLKQLYKEKALLARLDYVIRLLEVVIAPSFLGFVIENRWPFFATFLLCTIVLLILMELRERLKEEIRTKEKIVSMKYRDTG